MCQAMKEIIKVAVKEEKEKNKAAMKRIKELEKMVKNLQAQLKMA